VQELLGWVAAGRLHVHATLPDSIARIRVLMGKYAQMDLADASLVVL